MRLGVRKEQVIRYRKYVYGLRHLTPKKLGNILGVEWKLRTGNPRMEGLYPYLLFVDLTNTCNLKCPLCPTGQGSLIPRENRMDLANYRKVIEPLKDYLYQVFLYNNTEPFLNGAIYDVIAFNRASNIGSIVSSNLSLKVDSERLVASGLEYLIVSGDGVTQEVYEQYRINGKVQLVMDNVRRIVEARKKQGSGRPVIEWQCLLTNRNEHQRRQIEDTAYGLGVDVVRFTDIGFYAAGEDAVRVEKEWLPADAEYRTFESTRLRVPEGATRRPCHFLWRTAIVNSNGGVIPCCYYDTEDWGNVLDAPFLEVWNNDRYQKTRRLSQSGNGACSGTVCDRCEAPFIWKA